MSAVGAPVPVDSRSTFGAVWASIIDFIVSALMVLSNRVLIAVLTLAVVGAIVMLVS